MEQEKAKYLEESRHCSTILLHGPPKVPQFNCLSLSPFTAKLQSFFSFYNIDYQTRFGFGLRSTQHNKTPFISYKGKEYGDSQLIIDMICNERNIDIDKELNQRQKAISFAFRIATQELYWIEMYRRFHDENYYNYLSTFIPNQQMIEIIKDKIKTQLYQQGTGRYDDDTVYKMYKQHVEGIIEYMDGNNFFFGDKITSIDFTIYGILSGMYSLSQISWGNQQNNLILKDQVTHYINRFEVAVWGEINGWK